MSRSLTGGVPLMAQDEARGAPQPRRGLFNLYDGAGILLARRGIEANGLPQPDDE